MPKQQTHIRVVREWCTSLGVLTAVSISRQEAEMKLAAYVPMLLRDFPDAAFTVDSLHDVARRCAKGFPTYPELADHLSAWWRPRRPIKALPPPPKPIERSPPTPEELAAAQAVVREVTAALRMSAILKDTIGRSLDDPATAPQPRYLTPEQLDAINPLPNGRKRA